MKHKKEISGSNQAEHPSNGKTGDYSFKIKFLIHWYYFWCNLISYPMLYLDWPVYKYYHKWACKSADYDIDYKYWKKPDESAKRNKALD